MEILIELYHMQLDAFLEVYDDYATLVLLKRNDENDYDTEEHFDITLNLEDAEKVKSILCGREEDDTMDKKYEALPLWIDPNTDPDEVEMDQLTVDGLIEYLMIGGEITGLIDGEKSGVLNVREDYATFFVGYNGSIVDMDIHRDEFGPNTVLYKGKTLKELLEEDIFYDVNVY